GTLMCGARPEELARAHACVSHLWAGAGPRPERGQRNIQWRGQRLRGLAVVAAGRNREPAGLGTVRSVNARRVNARRVTARSVNARSVNAWSVKKTQTHWKPQHCSGHAPRTCHGDAVRGAFR